MPAVVCSIEIKAPPSVVWRWLAIQDALRRWLSPNLEIVPEGRLILSWLEEGGNWVHPARLVISLTPTPSGTQVALSHDGFAGIGKPGWQGTEQAYERGADQHHLLEDLAELVAGGGA